jgi:hypothetical protein
MPTSRAAGVSSEATGAGDGPPTCQRQRRRDAVEALANPRAKGGMSAVAKKAAKGGKKKGGKKR